MFSRPRIPRQLRELLTTLLGLLLAASLFTALYKIHTDERPRLKRSSGAWPDRSHVGLEAIQDIQAPLHADPPLILQDEFADGLAQGDSEHDIVPEYREIFSHTSRSRKFWPISYPDASAGDPTIIPHPLKSHVWMLIVRRNEQGHDEEQLIHSLRSRENQFSFSENSKLLVLPDAVNRPLHQAMSPSNARSQHPHSVRVFYGPDVPYVMHTSFTADSGSSIWIQDALWALDAFHFRQFTGPQWFSEPTQILGLEGVHYTADKHPLIFWDASGQMYVHKHEWPQRSFAPLEPSGVIGDDLAPLTRKHDQMCYGQYLRHISPHSANIQQASNSLSVTLCRRNDPTCMPNDSNTFIMHIVNIKYVHSGQSVYEPYPILFRRHPPFALHAIAQRPLWIHGREYMAIDKAEQRWRPERFDIVSMSWRSHVQKYHGYIDDALFLGFGIEESKAGFLDVVAGDLLQDIGLC